MTRARQRRAGIRLTPLLLVPAALLLILGLAVPLAATGWLSLSPNTLVRFPGHGFGNFAYMLNKPYYAGVVLRSVRLAAETTLASLVLGYPAALVLRGLPDRLAGTLMLAMTLPILAGPLVVVLGWMILLSDGGPLLQPLAHWGLIGRSRILGSEAGMVIGIVHFVMPFVVLSLAGVLRAIPDSLLQAAEGLGASEWQRFRSVILPLSLPGLLSATIIALSLSVGSFIAPHYLGGPADTTLTTLVAQFVLATYNGELAAAASVVLLAMMTAAILLLTTVVARGARP
jgi:ABC-type spermidine/putrescine transport system permease subunit I